MDRLEIYPKQPNSFYAIPATKCDHVELETELEDWSELTLDTDTGELYIIQDGQTDTHVPSGYYFVVCGPFWTVLSSTELMDDFRIG